jgi:GTP cyclohydrolase I
VVQGASATADLGARRTEKERVQLLDGVVVRRPVAAQRVDQHVRLLQGRHQRQSHALIRDHTVTVLTEAGKTALGSDANLRVTQTTAHHLNGHGTLDPAERAAADFLTALGADLHDESVRGTPRRMARMYRELLTPAAFRPTTFPNDGGYDELVVARAIPFHSLCEHHLLPFVGIAHVGYLPGERILGLSKLARVVDFFARSLQVQERLTTQIAGWLEQELAPRGVGVVLEAEHLCMSLRGVQKQGATTVTSALHGLVRDDPRTRQEFLSLTERTTHGFR